MGERGVLAASRNQTIRELWEGVRDRHSNTFPAFGRVYCCVCERKCPCPDYVDAVAALDQLDACGQYPLPAVHSEGYVQHARGHYAYRLIPDPGVDAEHAPKEHP